MISAPASASRPILMKHPLANLVVFALLAATLHAQDPSTPDSPPQNPPASSCAQEPGERRGSVGLLPKNILCDQQNIWLFPIRAPHNRRWIPALAVISFTAALVATDATPRAISTAPLLSRVSTPSSPEWPPASALGSRPCRCFSLEPSASIPTPKKPRFSPGKPWPTRQFCRPS